MCPAEGDTANVGEYVVADDEGSRQEEPDHALENVVHNEVGLNYNKVKGHVRPGEVGELEFKVACFQVGDKEDEANYVEDEADEAMMGGEGKQHAVDEHNVLEVVNDRLSIEKIHGGNKPVPVEALCRTELPGAAGYTGDSNDLLE